MKNLLAKVGTLAFSAALFISCDSQENIAPSNEISNDILSKIAAAGLDAHSVIKSADGGYFVEGDIYLTNQTLNELVAPNYLPNQEQYSTNNLVSTSGSRVIKMYAPQGGSTGYSAGMIAGLDLAISRYNAMNLSISFQRITTSTGADIVMTRLNKRDERQGVLGSAGFPTGGNPYGEIKMSGVLESSYNLSTGGIATIIGHEMGHCIGFRHTDYYNRAISCGGATSNEGTAGVGANHIPGTPTTATASAKSWMLACTDGSDRPFNSDDQVALNFLY